MRWTMASQLDDVFAEISFDGLDARLFQSRIEMDLLGRHRLRLHDARSAALANQVDNNLARRCPVLGPVNLSTPLLNTFFERFEMNMQVRERFVLDLPGALSHQVGIRQKLPGLAVSLTERVAQLAEDDLQARRAEGFIGRREKLVVRRADVVSFGL